MLFDITKIQFSDTVYILIIQLIKKFKLNYINKEMSAVNRYRVFCETEQINVYTWDTLTPTVCRNNNTHTINTGSIVIVDNINTTQTEITNLVADNTQTLQVLQKIVYINLLPFLGVSLLRNNPITTGSGSISNTLTESEINMNCSGADDSCVLRSIDRGIYISGLTCEVGIAIRLPTNLTGNQEFKWGYYSNQNGFYFKLTSTDFQVCILNNSVETCISQADFNADKLDGNGKSGHNLDFTKGNIFIILFSWYGFGLVSFQLHGSTNSSKQSIITMHEYQTVGQTSTRIPNLPIQLGFSNNGTVANTNVYIAGRQFSILGDFIDTSRHISMLRYLASISNEFLPIMSIKRKNAYTGTNIRLSEIYAKSSDDCEVQFISGGTLTSTLWGENPHHSESATEVDITSTGISGGIIVYSMILFAGETRNRIFEDTFMNLNEENPLTIIVKSLAGGTGNISIKISYKEYW
jgi:hypothetical protein